MTHSHHPGISVQTMVSPIPHGLQTPACPPGHEALRVLDIAARDALSVCYRYEGLWVEVLTERKFYRLIGELTNDCWVSCGHGGGDGDISPDDLPIASKTQKGIVQIGDNISVDSDGMITVPAAADDTAGVVELASAEEAKTGTDTSKAVTPAGLAEALVQDKVNNPLPVASKTQKGIVQIGNGLTVVDGIIGVPETGIATDTITGLVKGGGNISIAEDGTLSVPDLADMMMRGIGVKNLSGLSTETIPPNDFDQLWDVNRINSIQSVGQLNGPGLGSGVAFCFGTSTGTRIQLFCAYNGNIALRSQASGTTTSWEKFVRKSEFISQKSSSGYIMLPDGLMFQWLSASVPIDGGAVLFPVTFPSVCVKAFCTIKSSYNNEASATYSDNTKSGIYVRHNAGVVAGVSVFAIGY